MIKYKVCDILALLNIGYGMDVLTQRLVVQQLSITSTIVGSGLHLGEMPLSLSVTTQSLQLDKEPF